MIWCMIEGNEGENEYIRKSFMFSLFHLSILNLPYSGLQI